MIAMGFASNENLRWRPPATLVEAALRLLFALGPDGCERVCAEFNRIQSYRARPASLTFQRGSSP